MTLHVFFLELFLRYIYVPERRRSGTYMYRRNVCLKKKLGGVVSLTNTLSRPERSENVLDPQRERESVQKILL